MRRTPLTIRMLAFTLAAALALPVSALALRGREAKEQRVGLEELPRSLGAASVSAHDAGENLLPFHLGMEIEPAITLASGFVEEWETATQRTARIEYPHATIKKSSDATRRMTYWSYETLEDAVPRSRSDRWKIVRRRAGSAGGVGPAGRVVQRPLVTHVRLYWDGEAGRLQLRPLLDDQIMPYLPVLARRVPVAQAFQQAVAADETSQVATAVQTLRDLFKELEAMGSQASSEEGAESVLAQYRAWLRTGEYQELRKVIATLYNVTLLGYGAYIKTRPHSGSGEFPMSEVTPFLEAREILEQIGRDLDAMAGVTAGMEEAQNTRPALLERAALNDSTLGSGPAAAERDGAWRAGVRDNLEQVARRVETDAAVALLGDSKRRDLLRRVTQEVRRMLEADASAAAVRVALDDGMRQIGPWLDGSSREPVREDFLRLLIGHFAQAREATLMGQNAPSSRSGLEEQVTAGLDRGVITAVVTAAKTQRQPVIVLIDHRFLPVSGEPAPDRLGLVGGAPDQLGEIRRLVVELTGYDGIQVHSRAKSAPSDFPETTPILEVTHAIGGVSLPWSVRVEGLDAPRPLPVSVLVPIILRGLSHPDQVTEVNLREYVALETVAVQQIHDILAGFFG